MDAFRGDQTPSPHKTYAYALDNTPDIQNMGFYTHVNTAILVART